MEKPDDILDTERWCVQFTYFTPSITAGDAGKVVMGSSTGVISTTSGTTLANCYGTVTVTATDATSNVGTATAVICIGICTSNCDGSSGPSVHGSVLAFLVAALLTALKF